MNKTLIIIRREFFYRVRKKSFIILTILMPFIFSALIFIPLLLSMIKSDDTKEIAVIDYTGQYFNALEDNEYEFIESVAAPVRTLLDSVGVYAVLEIKQDLVKHPDALTLYSYKEIPLSLSETIQHNITEEVRKAKLELYNIPELKSIMYDYNKEVKISTIKLNEDGTMNESNMALAMGIGMTLTFLIYMFVMSYGGMVMQSVTEEKTNRIVELMVSSVRPFQLMIGKITGIGLVGIFQLTIWGILLLILTAVGGMFIDIPEPNSTMAAAGAPEVNAEMIKLFMALNSIDFTTIIVLFILNFIGGYLVYASLFAAIGAAINEPEDSQQFMVPIIFLMIFALYAAIYSADNPEGPLAFWCSMIPFTSPIVSMVRVALDIPIWESILSIVILYATAILLVWLAGRIYRVGILMYGKKPSIKDIIKWVTYK